MMMPYSHQQSSTTALTIVRLANETDLFVFHNLVLPNQNLELNDVITWKLNLSSTVTRRQTYSFKHRKYCFWFTTGTVFPNHRLLPGFGVKDYD